MRGQGGASIVTATQSAEQWLDLRGYRDLVAWLDVREWSASAGVNVLLTFQTAPTLDEMLFVPMTAPIILAPGLTVLPMFAAITSVQLGRYLRWSLAPSAITANPWDATFRCLIAANRPGGARRLRGAGRTPYDRNPPTTLPHS